MKFKNILQNTTWIDGCIVRFTESKEILMDVLYALKSNSVYTNLQGERDHPSGSTEKYK